MRRREKNDGFHDVNFLKPFEAKPRGRLASPFADSVDKIRMHIMFGLILNLPCPKGKYSIPNGKFDAALSFQFTSKNLRKPQCGFIRFLLAT